MGHRVKYTLASTMRLCGYDRGLGIAAVRGAAQASRAYMFVQTAPLSVFGKMWPHMLIYCSLVLAVFLADTMRGH